MEEHRERVVSILDDDESVRRSVGNLLSSVGFVVAAFDSAESFLRSGLPDVVEGNIFESSGGVKTSSARE